ncbi:DUF6530 family protein [Rhodovastum atsumiense]|uniref:Uncharacterized protein n=1 Tax=Rhodovastum atsumiense TaxID=504468 RepID=A0A5M6IJR5_9PROT|nr:DUF6530 family protein [Rhodovastum atsumiense]KAA5608079.1 hypothetical protein F1189_30780 [Rhodovastum atsumiense]
MPQLELPLHLAHQPVFAVPYFHHDGNYAGNTDCQYISVGWAQYDSHEISVKTLRHTEERWSRQSEELPVSRIIDATTVLALSLLNHGKDSFEIPADFLEKQPEPITVERTDRERNPSRRDSFSRTLAGDHIMRRRLSKLADVLAQLRKDRII